MDVKVSIFKIYLSNCFLWFLKGFLEFFTTLSCCRVSSLSLRSLAIFAYQFFQYSRFWSFLLGFYAFLGFCYLSGFRTWFQGCEVGVAESNFKVFRGIGVGVGNLNFDSDSDYIMWFFKNFLNDEIKVIIFII